MTSPTDNLTFRPTDRLAIDPDIAALPKADIHVHAEAAARLDQLLNPNFSYDWKKWVDSVMADVEPGQKRLEAMASIPFDTGKDSDPYYLEERLFDLFTESANSRSIYIEARTGVRSLDNPHFVTAFRKAEQRVVVDYPVFVAEPVVTFLVDPDRSISDRKFEQCVEAAGNSIVGVDIIPTPYTDEADWKYLNKWCERLASAGLGITIHAGEFSAANLRSATEAPGVSRIGHAVHARNDQKMISEILDRNLTLEMCISSNVVLGAIQSYVDHPIREYAAAGIKLGMGSDDPVRVCSNIGREYQIAKSLGMNTGQLLGITRQSVQSSFAPDDRKKTLLAVLDSGDGASRATNL
jgi:adenosine deaminase